MSPLIKTLHELTATLETTLAKKNTDYSGTENPFAGWALASNLSGHSPTELIFSQLTIKVIRMKNLLNRDPAVSSEPLEDTILDAIGYLVILKAWRDWHTAGAEKVVKSTIVGDVWP